MQPTEKNDVFKNLFRFFRLEGAKFPQGVNIFGRRRERTLKKHARKALPCMPGTCAAEGGGGTRGKNGAVRGRRKRDGAKAEGRLRAGSGREAGGKARRCGGKGGEAGRARGGRAGDVVADVVGQRRKGGAKKRGPERRAGQKKPLRTAFSRGKPYAGAGASGKGVPEERRAGRRLEAGRGCVRRGKTGRTQGKKGLARNGAGREWYPGESPGKRPEMCGAGRGACFRGKGKNTE